MLCAAAYIRVSTEDQTEYSPDAQLRAIKEYCTKNDYYLDSGHIYIDEGKSGRKAEKRPAFMKMIGMAKKKPAPFQVILCHKFDRFARNREDSVVYKSLLLKECGVKVISITESIENDKISLIMESMLEAMAEYYSINLAEEVKKGMTEKARRGEPLSIAPFGYKIEDKKLIPVPEEAEAVKQIFDDFIAGKSYFQIAKECNGKGLRTHRGGLFENRTIDYMLHNPTYAGYIRWTPTTKIRRNFNHPDSMIIKGSHEAIIDMAVFEAADKRAREIKALWKPYYKPQYRSSHWLVGLLRAPCGSSMVNSNGYFICSAYAHGACRERNSIKVEELDRRVLSYIKECVANPQIIKVTKIEEAGNSEIENAIANLYARLQRAKDAYERGIDTIDEYAESKAKILNEINALKQKIKPNSFAQSTDIFMLNIKEFLESDGKAAIARKLIKSIVYNKETKTINIEFFAKLNLPFGA